MQQTNTLFHLSILVMVFGDGRVVGYDLDQPTELSSAVEFLREKYPAVIGTCLRFLPRLFLRGCQNIYDQLSCVRVEMNANPHPFRLTLFSHVDIL